MENYREKLLVFIRINGPVIPVQVSKLLNTNIIFAGAILSELVANKHVLVSNTKKGGSPFYYVKGQENKLQGLAVNLTGKEKEAYELIKEKKVVRDLDAQPWQRVALRSIKDFTVPIEVQFNDKEELFWKWYMLSDEETKVIVGKILENLPSNQPKDKKIEDMEVDINQKIKTLEKEQVIENKEINIKKFKKEKISNFNLQIQNYFDKSKIKVLEQIIKKGSKELEYIVEVPTNIGDLNFYLKAKDKRSINESDLAVAYALGQQKKLQAIFLSNGNLTKKAKEYLSSLKGQLTFIYLNNLQ